MKLVVHALSVLSMLIASAAPDFSHVNSESAVEIPATDANIVYSPYNWYLSETGSAQSANPGAYLKVGFTGPQIDVKVDVSAFAAAKVPVNQYPLVRYSVDGGPPTTLQLRADMVSIPCAAGLKPGSHTLLLQYVSGYVFLDFWSPVNAVRVTGFELGPGESLVKPIGPVAPQPRNVLFLGDSITNGDDNVATFKGGITNEVDTQDATLGYPSVVAAGLEAEYGLVAYGGASWDHRAADGHTPGLLESALKLDSIHSRLVDGKLSPSPDDIFINMGENSGPSQDDVPKLLSALRAASGPKTNIFVIVPFSGRSRAPLSDGVATYRKSAAAASDSRTYLLDIGNCPYLTNRGPTILSVDGQHPLAALHALLGAQILEARSRLIQETRR